jgi:glycolate oxidase iron-sulfur subunit
MTQPSPTSPGEGEIRTTVEPAGDCGVFDAFHPPSAQLLADCVHCGFCLPTCPTYAVWGVEMDSPRGRIWLMKAGLEGEVEMDRTFVQHFDQCLGCMACVTACPSGVQYDELIESTRAQIERNFTRSPRERALRALIFSLFPYPRRLRIAGLLGWVYQRLRIGVLIRAIGLFNRLPAEIQSLESLLPDVSPRAMHQRLPEHLAAIGPPRRRVGLLTGCVQSVYFGDVNAATARVLALEGCDVVTPRAQGCCGALNVHAGRDEHARAFARDTIATFEAADVDTVVINAAGCGSTLKEYDKLLADDPQWASRAAAFTAKVRDITELLDELGPQAPRHPITARVAYHDACHLAHAQKVRAQPRRQLSAIPGLEVLDIPEPEICCGSAGIYNLVMPEPAAELGRRKAANVASTRPDVIATGNPGCLLQIRRHLDADIPVLHPVQLIDASLRGLDPIAAATTPFVKE